MKNREMVIQGKNIKGAPYMMAKKLLQADEKNIYVEVLDKGRKGLLGLWGRPATIRASLIIQENPARQEQSFESDEEGLAVVTEGLLRVVICTII